MKLLGVKISVRNSVVHEPSRLESFEPGGASSPSRLESLGTQLLAARTGVDEPT